MWDLRFSSLIHDGRALALADRSVGLMPECLSAPVAVFLFNVCSVRLCLSLFFSSASCNEIS